MEDAVSRQGNSLWVLGGGFVSVHANMSPGTSGGLPIRPVRPSDRAASPGTYPSPESSTVGRSHGTTMSSQAATGSAVSQHSRGRSEVGVSKKISPFVVAGAGIILVGNIMYVSLYHMIVGVVRLC